MENNLDFSPPNDQNLRKAKTTFHLISALFIIAVALPFLNRYGMLDNRYNLLEVLFGITLLIILLLSPVALYYIVRSYRHKEEKKVQKLLYLIGILFFNALVLLLLFKVSSDVL